MDLRRVEEPVDGDWDRSIDLRRVGIPGEGERSVDLYLEKEGPVGDRDRSIDLRRVEVPGEECDRPVDHCHWLVNLRGAEGPGGE